MRRFEAGGVPRDLGLAQGRALRGEIRRALGRERRLGGRLLRGLLPRRDAATARLVRDLQRHFPHQAEWLDGVSLSAGVPLAGLVRELGRRSGPAAARSAVLGAAAGSQRRVARPVAEGLVLRRVAPEGRFASIELAWPTASAPLIGVNQAGLALAVADAPARPASLSAPVALFARDCLERFESAESAAAWCLARPAAAGGGLIFADAAGELLGVDAEGARRRAVRPRDGWLALGGVVRETGKPPPADPSELDAVLAAALTGAEPGAGPVAVADPAGRRLRVGSESWLAGEAEDGAAAAAGAA